MLFELESTARNRREEELHRAQIANLQDNTEAFKRGYIKGREDMREECAKLADGIAGNVRDYDSTARKAAGKIALEIRQLRKT